MLLAYGVNRPYLHLPELPSRRYLLTEIMPRLREHCRSILFVGTASYTWQYETLFEPERYTTLDIAPAAAVWGAARHIVAPVQELTRHRPPGSFEGVILNGVLGFGIDTAREMRRTFAELHRAMRPGGLLVVGWNTDRHGDPETLDVLEGFERIDERRRFPPETHVYDVYRRQ
jgi:hypothetical protein